MYIVMLTYSFMFIIMIIILQGEGGESKAEKINQDKVRKSIFLKT